MRRYAIELTQKFLHLPGEFNSLIKRKDGFNMPKYAKVLVDKNALVSVQESISIGKQIFIVFF